MQICVCGWYYYTDLLYVLDEVIAEGEHEVMIVAHRYNSCLKWHNIYFYVKDNIGVEYGAYNYFIHNFWDKESKVLFMHDDVVINPIMKDYKMLPRTTIFNSLANVDVDLGYIFQGRFDELENFGIHGRGIMMSPRFIQHLLDNHKGIWFDKDNDGHISGPTPDHCYHFNEADYRLRGVWRNLQEEGTDMKVGVPIYAPSFSADIRGGRSNQAVVRIDRFKTAPMKIS